MKLIWSFIVIIDQVVLLLVGTYMIAVAALGAGRIRPSKMAKEKQDWQPRFLCVTAAHNESAVIGLHVQNLMGMEYPKDLFDVVVVADNCTDDTAALAVAAGAHVWTRHNRLERGKGFALRWAFHERAALSDYDAVCVFDADNLVDPNFLQVMAQHLREGQTAIQAYLDTKNPWDSWTTSSYAMAYWFMNRFWQHPRIRLGLSGALGGTGFCLDRRLLDTLPWEATSLTEDLEYSVRVVLGGQRVYWTPLTRVYDEKPVSLKASFPQRTRWLRGHWTTAFRYSGALLKKSLRGNFRARWQALDILAYLWQPLVILLTGLNILLSAAQLIFGDRWYSHWLAHALPLGIWAGLVALSGLLPLMAFAVEDVDWKTFVLYPLFLLFNVTWIPITLIGLWQHRETGWSHTRHTRAVPYQDMSAQK